MIDMKKIIIMTIILIANLCCGVSINDYEGKFANDEETQKNEVTEGNYTFEDNAIILEQKIENEVKNAPIIKDTITNKTDKTENVKNEKSTKSIEQNTVTTTSKEKVLKKKNTVVTENAVKETKDSKTKDTQNIINKAKQEEKTKESEKTTSKTETKKENNDLKCINNKHFMKVGNSNKWFNTEAEAIAFYNAEISKWSKKWTNFEIDDEEYYKKCPYRI